MATAIAWLGFVVPSRQASAVPFRYRPADRQSFVRVTRPARVAENRRISAPPMRAFAELVGRAHGAHPLAGFQLLGVQHMLGSTGTLVRGLVASGVGEVSLIPKPYSQHAAVVDELARDGFDVVRLPSAQRGLVPLNDSQLRVIAHRVTRAIASIERELAETGESLSRPSF